VGGGSPTVKQSRVAPAKRIVLHGVHFRTPSDKIDKSSLAVLDTAVTIVKENPNILFMLQCAVFRMKAKIFILNGPIGRRELWLPI
jgi:hypothetical protein